MAVDSIAQINSDSLNLQQKTVGMQDFLKIFLTQLNYQDPLKPVDNAQFIAQLAQFSSLELANQTNTNVQNLIDVQAISQTVGLIGKTVEVSAKDGSTVVGKVTTISFNNGNPEMTLQTDSGQPMVGISPSQIKLVRD